MDSQPEPTSSEMAPPTGSLEVPEGLRAALTGKRGEDGTTLVTDLPSVIVGSILSRIPNPFDVASGFRASRVFWGLARSAPFRLRLRSSRYQDTSGFGDDLGSPNRTGKDGTKLAARTRAALTGIRSVMSRTQELDLAGCPILDDDVTGVLADLHCLECLVLDGCQKLTSSAADALALSVRSGPRVLSLQRCFRLGPAAAGNLLAAAAAEGSQLETILLSHLDGLDLPQEPLQLNPVRDGNDKEIEQAEIVRSVGSSDPGAGLRILALHNCGSLGNSQLVAISETCPHLEVLMLGGSVDGLGLSRPDIVPSNKAMEAVSALVGATERLSRLRILEITFFTSFVARAVRDLVSKSSYVWDFCDKNSVATAAAVVASLRSTSQSNGEDYVLGFPDDLSVGCNILSLSEQDHLESEACLGHKRDREFEGVNGGELLLSKTSSSQSRRPHQGFDKRWDSNAEDILMALRAGANCSGARRRTPLHVAAALGESAVVANLLSIGAAARGMKDSAGASALFLAAESGHAQVCDHLLRGGADVLASNRTGETPLYIAALRGHSAAVEVMLRHCQEYGINWQDADVYGDGWTPLMAATVADRQEVGKVLLCAAGSTSKTASEQFMCLEPKACWDFGAKDEIDDTSNFFAKLSAQEHPIDQKFASLSGPAPQLLDAQNRYGQTALHIAARRGFLWFVSNLLRAGASPHVQDEYGLRAVDVARKQNHSIVEKLLKEWGEETKLGNGQASTSKKQPGSRKKGAKKEAAANKTSSGGNLKNQSSSTHRVVAWVPKNSSRAKYSGDSTPDCSSHVESSSTSELDQELPSLPDSPTSIVPSWMHSSPPVSPRFEQLPATIVEHRNLEDGDRRGSTQDIPDLLESEAGHIHDRIRNSHNYWRRSGTRQRTSSGEFNIFISSDD
ncbi:unnamed protein product [Calypogeia fissa]